MSKHHQTKKGIVSPGLDVNALEVVAAPPDVIVAARKRIRERIPCPLCGWPPNTPGFYGHGFYNFQTKLFDMEIRLCHHEELTAFWKRLEATSIVN